jgi:hypothetical protein
LEYELTLAKKATNQVRRVAAEKEVESTNNVALVKDQLFETKTKLAGVEQELANTKNIRKNEAGQWKKHLQTKVNFYKPRAYLILVLWIITSANNPFMQLKFPG